jgi:hypothetical protein
MTVLSLDTHLKMQVKCYSMLGTVPFTAGQGKSSQIQCLKLSHAKGKVYRKACQQYEQYFYNLISISLVKKKCLFTKVNMITIRPTLI